MNLGDIVEKSDPWRTGDADVSIHGPFNHPPEIHKWPRGQRSPKNKYTNLQFTK